MWLSLLLVRLSLVVLVSHSLSIVDSLSLSPSLACALSLSLSLSLLFLSHFEATPSHPILFFLSPYLFCSRRRVRKHTNCQVGTYELRSTFSLLSLAINLWVFWAWRGREKRCYWLGVEGTRRVLRSEGGSNTGFGAPEGTRVPFLVSSPSTHLPPHLHRPLRPIAWFNSLLSPSPTPCESRECI